MAGVGAKTFVILLSVAMSAYLLHQVSAQVPDADFLILGAGTAGLEAARTLQAEGALKVLILEGSDHVGGSIESTNFGGLDIPTGKWWLYDPEGEDVLEAVQSVGFELNPTNYYSYVVHSENRATEDVTEEFDERYEDFEAARNLTGEIVDQVLQGRRADLPARTALAMSNWVASDPVSHVLEWWYYDFSQGVQARRMSTFAPYLQELGEEYTVTNINQGLFPDVLPLLNEDNLKLNKVVRHIDQTGDLVVVTCEDGDQYTAKYGVLVTFSVGVLQHGGVTFSPPLPAWKTEPIFNYQPAIVEHILLRFSAKFWDDEEWILHAADRPQDVDRHYYPAFRNLGVENLYGEAGSTMLAVYITGDEALRVEGLTDEEIQEEILEVLRSLYGDDNVSNLEEFYFRRWATDPLHYSTFTTWPVPAYFSQDIAQRLASKVGRVFFAQEAGTGAEGSELAKFAASDAAVGQLLRCVNEGDCDDYEPVELRPGGVEGGLGGEDEDEDDDDELYGCVRVLKKEGKTRKVIQRDISGRPAELFG